MDVRWRWMIPYLIIDFPNRIFYGIFGSLIGPSQPYLAFATNVDLATINLLWTLGKHFRNWTVAETSFLKVFDREGRERESVCEWVNDKRGLPKIKRNTFARICFRRNKFCFAKLFNIVVTYYNNNVSSYHNPLVQAANFSSFVKMSTASNAIQEAFNSDNGHRYLP